MRVDACRDTLTARGRTRFKEQVLEHRNARSPNRWEEPIDPTGGGPLELATLEFEGGDTARSSVYISGKTGE